MKLSIAMTTYNGSQYIIRQLNSLKNQTRYVHEVVIVDDHSTDDTADIILAYIKEYHLDHWRFYINKENIGYKRNFKEVLSKVTGDYIFLCDQDDIWSKRKVEYMMKILETHHDIECLTTSYHLMNENDEKLEDHLLLNNVGKNEVIEIPTSDIFIKNISMGCTSCISKKIKDIYLSKTNTMAPHDWELNAIASFYDGLYYFNHPLIYYRIHSKNTTGLDVGSKDDKVNARKKNSIQIDNYLSSLSLYKEYMTEEDYAYLKRLQSFSQKRTMLLNGGSRKIWFSLIKERDIYKSYVSVKGMLVELLK